MIFTTQDNRHTGARGMWLKAKRHDDRYLLPRRYGRGPDTELYRAARWLVLKGYARWLSGSSMGPGIELTRRPWD